MFTKYEIQTTEHKTCLDFANVREI